MTIFSARGQKMKMVIDGYFIAKKKENWKILSKTGVIYLKKTKSMQNSDSSTKSMNFWERKTKDDDH